LEEFEEKKFWKSELYIDNGKKIHNALALTKVGWMGTFMMLFANKNVKEAEKKTRDTPGNLQGDGRYGWTFSFFPSCILTTISLCSTSTYIAVSSISTSHS
jgi:hypothetical protein